MAVPTLIYGSEFSVMRRQESSHSSIEEERKRCVVGVIGLKIMIL